MASIIRTSNGVFELGFTLYTSGAYGKGNSNVISDVQNIYTTQYIAYKDIKQTIPVGMVYYSGQANLINDKVFDTGLFTIDLTDLKLGTITATFAYTTDKNIIDAAPFETNNNAIVTSGTGDFAFSQGDLVVTDSFGLDLVQISFYKKV
jgi:hypothetical protein